MSTQPLTPASELANRNTVNRSFIGLGYSYITGGGGYELCGGLRYDIIRKEHVSVSALLYYELRTVAATDTSGTTPKMDASVFMPVGAAIEVGWR